MENKKILLIGDVHNDLKVVDKIVSENKNNVDLIIQLGDFLFSVDEVPSYPDNFKCIRGNHCNPSYYKEWKHYLGDYGYIEKYDLFYISGAWSIDWQMRTPEVNWWSGEELSWVELHQATELYKEVKPKYVISHECPRECTPRLLNLMSTYIPNRTSEALNNMLNIHQPDKWFFGHWHQSLKFKIKGYKTEFRCVDINESIIVDLNHD